MGGGGAAQARRRRSAVTTTSASTARTTRIPTQVAVETPEPCCDELPAATASPAADGEADGDAEALPRTGIAMGVSAAFAAALAYRRGLKHIVTGVCETDYSGYPDCRDDTIKAMQVALNLGLERRFVLETPLMWIDKAQTWALAETLGGRALVDLVVEESHTCYLGERGARHEWGYGCGTCPACDLRAKGFSRYLAARAE